MEETENEVVEDQEPTTVNLPNTVDPRSALMLAQLVAQLNMGAIRSGHEHKSSDWKQPCKKVKEESKRRRRMAAKSRKINRH
jgi:hypothetical protein